MIGPPSLICFLKRGTTDPEELRTFPNLTIENMILLFKSISLLSSFIISSLILLSSHNICWPDSFI